MIKELQTDLGAADPQALCIDAVMPLTLICPCSKYYLRTNLTIEEFLHLISFNSFTKG